MGEVTTRELTPSELCAPRPQAKRRKLHHIVEDFLAIEAGLDPRIGDARERARGAASRCTIRRTGGGDRTSLALYSHYNSKGVVSDLVLSQLEAYQSEGFGIIFISMSEIAPGPNLTRLESLTEAIILRKSFGRDFGAWADAAELLNDRLRRAEEVLLVNDSVLGPVRSMKPVFVGLRKLDEGVIGLTDCAKRRPHVQSYFLLFRGHGAIEFLLSFLGDVKLSKKKNIMIRRGELALTAAAIQASIPLRVLFPIERIEQEAAANSASYGALRNVLREDATHTSETSVLEQLQHLALNPTFHFWRCLVECLGFPFVKAELLRRNPASIPDIDDWPQLVTSDSPVSVQEVRDHLGEGVR